MSDTTETGPVDIHPAKLPTLEQTRALASRLTGFAMGRREVYPSEVMGAVGALRVLERLLADEGVARTHVQSVVQKDACYRYARKFADERDGAASHANFYAAWEGYRAGYRAARARALGEE